MSEYLYGLENKLSDKQIEDVFAYMDKDGNGWINFDEFENEVWQFKLLKRNRINRLLKVQQDLENRRLTPWYYRGTASVNWSPDVDDSLIIVPEDIREIAVPGADAFDSGGGTQV